MNEQELDRFRAEYKLARREGDRRFGTPCEHKQVRNGRCLKCLRKVIARKEADRG